MSPAMSGMPTRKTIAVPCMVNRRLNTCGAIRLLFGTASWARITAAMEPATTRKSKAVAIYIRPNCL